MATRIVVLADSAARLLVVVPDVNGGGAVNGGFHPLPVAIVDEDATGPTAYTGEPVLGVVGESSENLSNC
jgi:hypothetical protein